MARDTLDNLPDDVKNKIELAAQYAQMFGVDPEKDGAFHHAIVFRIDVGSLGSDEVGSYMSRVAKNLNIEALKQRGFLTFTLPVRNEKTTIGFINLSTMLRVEA